MAVPTTINPGPRSLDFERLLDELESHPIWTELRGPVKSNSNAGAYVPVAPTRILDTTNGTGGVTGPVAGNTGIAFQATGIAGVPTSCVSAVQLDVTVGLASATGSLTVYQDGTTRPATSNIDWYAGQTISNAVIAQVSSSGKIDMYNASTGTIQVLADISGYYTCTPGGSSGDIWSYPDLHGNTTVTDDSNGTQLGHVINYDPWGSPLSAPTDPNNAPVTNSFTTNAVQGKITDTTAGLTIMGARAFNAAEGRFAQVDPREGGCANAYTYSFGDPFLKPDFTGQASCDGTRPGCRWLTGMLQDCSHQLTLGDWAKGAVVITGIVATAAFFVGELGISLYMARVAAAAIDAEEGARAAWTSFEVYSHLPMWLARGIASATPGAVLIGLQNGQGAVVVPGPQPCPAGPQLE